MGCSLSRLFREGPSDTSLLDIPVTDIVSFVFDKQIDYDEGAKELFIDAQDPSRFLTAQQTKLLVRGLIAGLRAAGLKKGDGVLLHLANHYLYAALYLSIIGAGGICCGSNPSYQFFELNHIVDLAAPRFIITAEASLPVVREVCEKRSISLGNVFILGSGAVHGSDPLQVGHDLRPLRLRQVSERTSIPCPTETAPTGAGNLDDRSLDHVSITPRPFADLLAHGEAPWIQLRTRCEMQTTLAAYYSTSGTTGLPKLAIMSHYSLVAQQVALHSSLSQYYHGSTSPPTAPYYYEVTRLSALPLFHVFGAAWSIFATLRYGQPVYIMERFTSVENFVANVDRYGITETYITPPVVHAFNFSGVDGLKERLKTLRYVGVGGAPVDGVAQSKLRGLLVEGAMVSQVWGMTEFGVAAMFEYGETGIDGDSIGRLLCGYEMKLAAAGEGDEAEGGGKGQVSTRGEGKSGELLIKTPGMINGYKGMEAGGIFERDKDGEWLRTGDIVHVKSGKLYVTGRAKELIKVRGWHVAPAEIEAVLQQHPDVADCAVVGTSIDGGLTEVPRAYVIRKKRGCLNREEEPVTADGIYDFVGRRLASYKRLDGGIVFVDSIPRTASGKTQRFKLIEMEKNGLAAEVEQVEGK